LRRCRSDCESFATQINLDGPGLNSTSNETTLIIDLNKAKAIDGRFVLSEATAEQKKIKIKSSGLFVILPEHAKS